MTSPLCRLAWAGLLAALVASRAYAQGVPLPLIGQPPASRPAPASYAGPPPVRPAAPVMPTTPLPGTAPAAPAYGLAELTALMLERNPRLAAGAYAVDAAAGRAVQAGLYPNPVVTITQDEIGDKQSPGGILTAPMISQEIVTANKLGLSRAAAERATDQATLNLMSIRFARHGALRQAFYEVVALRRRAEILGDLVRLAQESISTSERLLKAGQASRLDLVQLEVERERFRAEREATLRELPAAFRRLATAVGVASLPQMPLAGSLDAPLPSYDLDRARQFVAQAHPDVLSARAGVKRAQLLLERARVEPIPNVTVSASYIRQFENRSRDVGVGVSLPVPLWNKNQGNIAAAQARLGQAVQDVGRAENEVVERLAVAFGTYASARRRAGLYRGEILPRAREAYGLALKGYRAGSFDYLRVLQAQRAYSQADLEAVRSLGEAWRAAGELSGLLLEDHWPPPPTPGPTIEVLPAPVETPK